MKEITLTLSGPDCIEKSHLAELLQDILLQLGYLVEPDPEHGFFTPPALRNKYPLPAIFIVEEHQQA